MPHSISHSDACLRLFNKKWGIPLHWLCLRLVALGQRRPPHAFPADVRILAQSPHQPLDIVRPLLEGLAFLFCKFVLLVDAHNSGE